MERRAYDGHCQRYRSRLYSARQELEQGAARDYLKGVMNGKTTIPTKTWKAEYAKLTAERKTLNQRYLALKEEVKEAEQIRRSVYNILRQEQRE